MESQAENATVVRQVAFYVGNDGTPTWFIALIIVSATSPSLIRNLLAVLYPDCTLWNNTSFWKTLAVDFCISILPVELNITLWNLYSPFFCVITYVIIILMLLWAVCVMEYSKEIRTTPFLTSSMINCPFVSYFRAYTNVFTGFSILAVDFVIYPSYFYKSRVYGTALMDSGLGFYVISNAIVSTEARGIVSKLSKTATLKKAVKDTIPLLFMGFARYHVTRMTGYHVPLQEYGVHWNFFFTLAVVKMCSTVLFLYTPVFLHRYLGVVVIFLHQVALSKGLRNFVLFGYNGDASRKGLLESNREGVVSSIGFVAIYFVGVQLGTILMKNRETIGQWMKTLGQLIVVCSSSWILMHITAHIVERPCRKFANLSYMFFVIGVTSLLMVEGLAFDMVITYFKRLRISRMPLEEGLAAEKSDRTCALLQAINFNGLLFFVIANLMTGIVNLSVDTQSFSRRPAFAIVTAYMLILSVIFLHLYRTKFSFKAYLWRARRKQTNIGTGLTTV